jgi:hypothetical protein
LQYMYYMYDAYDKPEVPHAICQIAGRYRRTA